MKTRIIVEVSGGNVQAIYSSDPEVEVDVMDWDNAECDEECKKECEAMTEEAKNLTPIY